jgi:Ice-binding-like
MNVICWFKTGFTALLLCGFLAGCGGDNAGNDDAANNQQNPSGKGPAPVSLGSSGDPGAASSYVILAKAGISNVTGSAVTGDIGLSPAAASFITGFSLVADPTNVFSTSSSVVGKIYASNYAVPAPTNLTTAIGSMQAAYNDAAGRSTPDFLEMGSGNLGGLTLVPGLYKWTSSLTVPADVTIAGGADDVWIFQTSGDLSISASKRVTLSGGAQAKNIFWQVAGHATLGATSHFEGILLSKTSITLQTGATMNGRALAQTQVALDNNAVTRPAQ